MPFISQHVAFGLNTDDDPSLLPEGDYRWLKNGRVGKSQGANAGTIENILGMLELDSSVVDAGTKFVGWIYNKELDEIYVFGWTNTSQTIYVIQQLFYDGDGTISKMLDNPNLGLLEDRRLWSIAIAGDDLIWTTGAGEIRAINITEAKAGGYNSAQEEDLLLLKRGPRMAPTAEYKTGASDSNNLLGESVYQFAYRYKYEHNQYSVLSPWSKTAYALTDDEDGYIEVAIPETPAHSTEDVPNNVDSYEWLVKIDNSTEWQIIAETAPIFSVITGKVIRYTREVLGVTVDNNDAYKLADALPRNVVALEFMKNRLFIANYVTGYNFEQNFGFNYLSVYGTTELQSFNDKVGFGYSSSIRLALQFYDQQGRPFGALRGQEVSTPRLLKRGNWHYLYHINWTINDSAITIPDEAWSYQVLRTDNQRKSFFLQEQYIDAYYLKEEQDGTRIWGKDYFEDTAGDGINWDYLMLDITLLNRNQMGYTFSEGDRVEFWLQDVYYDKAIEFVDGRFIAIKAFYIDNPFALANKQDDNFIIYTPSGEEQETTLHEVGENFLVNNPGTPSKSYSVLSGTLENGDTYYVDRDGGEWDGNIPPYSNSDPYANEFLDGAHIPQQAMNPFNGNYSVWQKGLGRASVLYEHPGQATSTATIRFSEERVPDSRINNINKWNFLDRYDQIGKERTGILKLTKARNVLIANHQRSTTSMYVNEGFVKTVDGGEFLAKSSGVITDDRELAGGYGCIPETIMEFEGRMWWADPYQGVVVRYTVNGTQSITDKAYKVERWFKDRLPHYGWFNNRFDDRFQSVPIAGYDPEFNEYYLMLQRFDEQYTMVFSEETQRWVGEFEYKHDAAVLPNIFMRTNFKSFAATKQKIYKFHDPGSPGYNNFFGEQKQRTITLIANPEPKAMKVWNNVWFTKLELVNGSVDPVVKITNKYGQETYVYVKDFINSEGIWKAPIYFDRNTANMTPDNGQINGERMRSEWIQLDIDGDLTTIDAHVLTQVMWKQSEFTR